MSINLKNLIIVNSNLSLLYTGWICNLINTMYFYTFMNKVDFCILERNDI